MFAIHYSKCQVWWDADGDRVRKYTIMTSSQNQLRQSSSISNYVGLQITRKNCKSLIMKLTRWRRTLRENSGRRLKSSATSIQNWKIGSRKIKQKAQWNSTKKITVKTKYKLWGNSFLAVCVLFVPRGQSKNRYRKPGPKDNIG